MDSVTASLKGVALQDNIKSRLFVPREGLVFCSARHIAQLFLNK